MQIVYRLIVCILGIIGGLEALFINIIYSTSTRFQSLVGLSPGSSHGFIGLIFVALALLGAILVLFTAVIPGGILLLIAGIGFFFIVHLWAIIASPQMIFAGILAFYYHWQQQQVRAARQPPPAEQPRGGAVA